MLWVVSGRKDVQARYPPAVVPAEGFDAFHELIYLDELAAVGPGGPWNPPKIPRASLGDFFCLKNA